MIIINKGSDDCDVEIIVMLIVAAAAAIFLVLLLVDSYHFLLTIFMINEGDRDDYDVDNVDLAAAAVVFLWFLLVV